MLIFPADLKDGEFVRASLINLLCQRNNKHIENHQKKTASTLDEDIAYVNRLMIVLIPLFRRRFEQFNFQKAIEHLIYLVSQLLHLDISVKEKQILLKKEISILTIAVYFIEKSNKEEEKAFAEVYKGYIDQCMRELHHIVEPEVEYESNLLLTKLFLRKLSQDKSVPKEIAPMFKWMVIELDRTYFESIPAYNSGPSIFSPVTQRKSSHSGDQETVPLLS